MSSKFDLMQVMRKRSRGLLWVAKNKDDESPDVRFAFRNSCSEHDIAIGVFNSGNNRSGASVSVPAEFQPAVASLKVRVDRVDVMDFDDHKHSCAV